MTSLIWPNLTIMDITRTHDKAGKRPLEWMTAAMNSIDRMIHVHHIIITDELHPVQLAQLLGSDDIDAILRSTSTFI
jgi:hypothetical protein